MHGEYVFDSKISVKFLKEKESSNENSSRGKKIELIENLNLCFSIMYPCVLFSFEFDLLFLFVKSAYFTDVILRLQISIFSVKFLNLFF